MGKAGRPRFGSMGVWPRKRAKKAVARVRSYKSSNDSKPLAFAGYKAGMTRILLIKEGKGKRASMEVSEPVTVIECPPMRIASLRVYKKKGTAHVVSQQINFKTEKELGRKTKLPKNFSNASDIEKLNPDDYSNVTIQMYTQPKLTGIKKTPELFEVELGGNVKDKLEFVKQNIDKPINVGDVFKEGQLVDAHAISKGKGFQGAVKRFGIGLKSHKSEKSRRTPGSLGGWKGQGHIMYRVAHAGQTGYHQRVQFNNLIMKMDDKPELVNPKGGFINYGLVKSPFILVKGSIAGPKKRLITLTEPMRQKKQIKFNPESIKKIMTESQQSR